MTTPTPAKLLKQADYARLTGVDKSFVTRERQRGNVVMVDGLVDVEATARLQEENRDPARGGVRDYHAKRRQAKAAGEPPDNKDKAGDILGMTFQKARTANEIEKARRARRENELEEGKLVPVEQAQQALTAFARQLRGQVEEWNKILAVELDLDNAAKQRLDDRYDAWLRAAHAELLTKVELNKGAK